jgi:glycosyltransferase involved in cell wall biosynthesis
VTEPVHALNSPIPKSSDLLHVLTLTPFYPTDRDDASGCFIAEPLIALQKSGIRHTVFAAQPIYRGSFHNATSSVPANWVRYLSLPGGFGLPSAGAFLFAAIVGKVRELHRSQPVDLIHAHGPLPCGHAAMLIAEELRIPYVVSVHGLDAFSDVQVSGRAGMWCRRIAQRTYRASRRVICISEHVREKVLEGVGRSCRTSVVYNGVDTELFQPSKAAAERTMILSVGNLIPIKGHEALIRAVSSVATEFPDITLEIIGDGAERPRLQALTEELRIAGKVQFPGRRSRSEVADAMRGCTLFALPSRYEGLGCVYLEAMCAGKAVIGCREQGIAEIIRHGSNGFLVGPENEKELEIALGMLLRDEQRRRNIERAARDTVLDRLTLEHQAENLARICRECVRERMA